MVNGKRYSWEDVTVHLPSGVAIDISKIEYSDEKDHRAIYGKGSMPRGRGAGNYKAEGKVTLLREEFERVLAYARQRGRAFYQLRPFEITVSYANEDEATVTDVLHECLFVKRSTSADQGAEKVEVELDLAIFGGITMDGVEADSNEAGGSGGLGINITL